MKYKNKAIESELFGVAAIEIVCHLRAQLVTVPNLREYEVQVPVLTEQSL